MPACNLALKLLSYKNELSNAGVRENLAYAKGSGAYEMIWRFACFYLDSVRFRLIDSTGRELPIQPKAFKVLECLVRHSPNVVSRQQLLEEVWGHSELCVNTLSQTIHEVRRALNEDASRPVIIGTRHGEGYFLLVDAEQLSWRELSSVTARSVLIRRRVVQVLVVVFCLAGGILIGMRLA